MTRCQYVQFRFTDEHTDKRISAVVSFSERERGLRTFVGRLGMLIHLAGLEANLPSNNLDLIVNIIVLAANFLFLFQLYT